ncbi:MAG: MBL fold metallo-hydrolase, partial [Methanocorpusculum sp.]|nr:MBL fold metallo-hydrolase [Methanocorpusculum sp.]
MKITALGTGDTVGTPKVGCDCEVCSIAKAGGLQRLRTSLLIQ